MTRETEDRRVRRTKALLRQCLTTLMREKSLKDITVTELTALADVNRGTFYCHYRDIYDLSEQLQNELFREFRAVLDSYTTDALRAGLGPILRDIFCFIDRNADICAAFFRTEGENFFFQQLKNAVFEKVLQEWGALYGIQEMQGGDYVLSFLVAGTVGMVQAWSRKDMRESPDEMAMLAERLMLRGLASFPVS